jgi:hypothetical protein
MSCCGGKRRALRAQATTPTASGVTLEYRRPGKVEIHGATGRAYVFTEARRIQTVHPRDARELLRSGAFRLL